MARATISDLPDALLIEVLRYLKPADLHRAALVGGRWHACAHTPELCRAVKRKMATRPLLRSLLAWLRRHGRHVRSLELHTDELEEEEGGSEEGGSQEEGSEEGGSQEEGRGDDGEGEARETLAGLLAACVTTCAAAGGRLESLTVLYSGGAPLSVGSDAWAPVLTSLASLQALRLTSMESSLQVAGSLSALSALSALCLASYAGLHVAPSARLPASIQELELEDWQNGPLPAQLSCLLALHTLVLGHRPLSADSYRVLERLPRLRRLHCSTAVPPCAPHLAGLRELVLTDSQDAAGLDAALRVLTGLTCLALIRGQPPPSVAGLSCLQRACFLPFQGGPHHQLPAALPTGPWAASLRQLHADYDTLLLSSQLLAAAGRLEQLAVLSGFLADEPSEASERFWRWCTTHPPLRRLHIELERLGTAGAPSPSFVAALAALARARPALQVRCAAEVGVVMFARSVEEFHHHV